MIRTSLVAALLAVASPALAGQPVALKTQPTSSAAGVTLGDLFDGATGASAKVVVAPAPAAGLNAVLEAGKVQIAARAAGLDWDNALGQRRIVVTGAPANAAASTASRTARKVQTLAYTRNIMAGEIVGPSDLEWSEAAIASADAPGDADAVIGMSARRPLRAGAAVSARDLTAPIVVKRDEAISVVFQAGGVSLTLQGKAMKDAGVGDTLQVMNPQSKKIIETVVAGPGKALVGPAAEALRARTLSPFSTASLR